MTFLDGTLAVIQNHRGREGDRENRRPSKRELDYILRNEAKKKDVDRSVTSTDDASHW